MFGVGYKGCGLLIAGSWSDEALDSVLLTNIESDAYLPTFCLANLDLDLVFSFFYKRLG